MEFKSNANIAEIFVNHFKKIYIGTENPSIIIDNLEWRSINSKHHANLCAAFEEEDIFL